MGFLEEFFGGGDTPPATPTISQNQEVVVDGRVVSSVENVPGGALRTTFNQSEAEKERQRISEQALVRELTELASTPETETERRQKLADDFFQSQVQLLDPEFKKQAGALSASQVSRGIGRSTIGAQEFAGLQERQQRTLGQLSTQARLLQEQLEHRLN